MESLILIPARGGSKGIPGKNLALLGGKPLIEHTIRAALDAGLPARICLTTDDERIREFGLTFPVEAPFLRPAELSQDGSGMIPVIQHALQWYKHNENFTPRFLILLQPTCPFRTAQNVREAYQMIIEENSHALISVNPVNEHPCEYVVQEGRGFSYVMDPPELPGRQNFPKVYFINGAIYMVASSFFLRQGTLFDKKALLYVMKQNESLDIDMPEQLDFANWFYEKTRKQKE